MKIEFELPSYVKNDKTNVLSYLLNNMDKWDLNDASNKVESCVSSAKSLNDYTWAEIKAISESGEAEKYFKVGDTKDITIDGATYQVAIAGFNHDTISGTSDKAGITFVMVDCVGLSKMNKVFTNEGGWADSYMRNTIMADIYKGMDSDLKNVIKSVDKLSVLTDGTTQTTSDKLFLFSVNEVYGVNQQAYSNGVYPIGIGNGYTVYNWSNSIAASADDIQYEYFKTTFNVIKKYNDLNYWYFLRSANAGISIGFRVVHSTGSCGNGHAISSGGIVLGFSI